MARYDFKCTNDDCALVQEHIQSMSVALPATLKCPRCEHDAKFQLPTTLAIGSASGDKTPLDVAIGRDAAARREMIAGRQAQRDKVRRENNQVGLVATSYNDFQPISAAQRKKRTEVLNVVARDGYNAAA